MIVLGMDVPGRRFGGYAVYDSVKDCCLEHGVIELEQEQSEVIHFQMMNDLINRLYHQYAFSAVAVEHPFLFEIAQWIGAVKMAVVVSTPAKWYMIGASSARKAVFGNAKRITRINRNGRVVSAAKGFVLDEMSRRFAKTFIQHEADAVLYAIATAIKLQELEKVKTNGATSNGHLHRGRRKKRADQD